MRTIPFVFSSSSNRFMLSIIIILGVEMSFVSQNYKTLPASFVKVMIWRREDGDFTE